MKRSTKLTLSVVAALGLAAVGVPVIAQQAQIHYGGMICDDIGMKCGHGGMRDAGHHDMMGSAMGMMGGAPRAMPWPPTRTARSAPKK